MLCRVAAVNVAPHIIIVRIIFSGPLGILMSFTSFENRVLLKAVLVDVAGVAHFITGHKHHYLA